MMESQNSDIPANIKSEYWKKFQGECEQLQSVPSNSRIEKLFDVLLGILNEIKLTSNVQETNSSQPFEEIVVCKQCSGIFYEPVTLFCGHTFCKECIRKRFEQSFIELCMKCDANSKKIKKWLFSKKRDFQKYQVNVVLSNLIEDILPDYNRCVRLRLEGNELFQAKNFASAEEKYEQALRFDPLNFLSWSNLSNCQTVNGKFSEALASAQRAIEISPQWAKAYYREAVAFKGLKNEFNSLLSYIKFVMMEASSPTVRQIIIASIEEITKPTEDVTTLELNNSHSTNIDRIFAEIISHGIDFITAMPSAGLGQRIGIDDNMDSFREKLSSELTCPLCCRIFYHSTTTPCGHTFCASCIERSLDYNPTCSICRHPIDKLINVHPKPVNSDIEMLVQRFFPEQYEVRAQEEKLEKQVFSCDASNIVEIPIFVCTFTFPTLECPLHIFEPRYKLLIRRCIESGSRTFGMCSYVDNDETKLFSDYGVMLEIRDFKTLDDGRFLVDAVGGKRFKVLERGRKDGYNTASVTWVQDDVIDEAQRAELESLSKSVYEENHAWLEGLPYVISCRLRQEFGQIPRYDEGALVDEQGPRWIWWSLRLLLQGDPTAVNSIMQSTSVKQRIDLIKERITIMQGLMNARR